eukprot:jgi/Bigna1/91762/estExt_fgenesh1_pg.C_1170029
MPAVHSVFWFSVGTGALSWVCFKMYEYEAGTLSSTPYIPIEDLPSQLESNGEPTKFTIEGVVACDEPLETKHRPGTPVRLVMYSLTKIAHFATTSIFGGWTEDEKHSTSHDSVPFYVIPDLSTQDGKASAAATTSSSRGILIPSVEINDGNGSSELLSVVGDVTVENKFTFQTFLERTRSSGRIHRSSQYVESGLEVGTPITMVGPVSMNKEGHLKMVAQPLVISRRSRYELITEAEERATFWQYAFYFCAATATSCILYMGYRYMQEYLQRRLARRRLAMLRERKYRADENGQPLENEDLLIKHHSGGGGGGGSSSGTSKGERKGDGSDAKGMMTSTDEEGDRRQLCVVCQENTADAVLLSCRHLYTCVSCTRRLHPRNCPICRQPIKRVIKVY